MATVPQHLHVGDLNEANDTVSAMTEFWSDVIEKLTRVPLSFCSCLASAILC